MSNDKPEITETEIKSAKKVIKFIKEVLGFSRVDTTSASAHEIIAGLTYMSSQNLVKHSKTLKCWTIVIGVSTILLFVSAVLQLIRLFFCP